MKQQNDDNIIDKHAIQNIINENEESALVPTNTGITKGRKPAIIATVNTIIDMAIESNPEHIFGKPFFPGIKTKTQPASVLYALVNYGNNINKTLEQCLKDVKCDVTLYFLRLEQVFSEFKSLKFYFMSQRSHKFGGEALKQYDFDKIPERFYEQTQHGERLTGAGATLLVKKADMMMKQAMVAERRQFNDKATVNHVHTFLQGQNANIDIDKLMETPIDDLLTQL